MADTVFALAHLHRQGLQNCRMRLSDPVGEWAPVLIGSPRRGMPTPNGAVLMQDDLRSYEPDTALRLPGMGALRPYGPAPFAEGSIGKAPVSHFVSRQCP
jgi:hypothetical protein